MQEQGLTVPRIHDLLALLARLLPYHASLQSLRRGLDFLTRYAVETRYPGDNASKRQAMSSLRWAERVRASARAHLGIRDRPTRRRKSP